MSLNVDKCLQAWTNSLKQMKAKADIVFYGDSITYYGDFASLFPDKVVCNLGLRGDNIPGLINRVEQVQIMNPGLVYLMAGINDAGYLSVDEFDALYNHLVDTIIQALPGASLVLQSILPVNTLRYTISCNNTQIRNCNNRIERIAKERGLSFIDTFSMYVNDGQLPEPLTTDGIHLTPKAYSLLYAAISDNS